ncbi:MAG: stage III sporulation protein AA [Clostridium sp.]|nr:stage III sporulation protein AA [Clostridium sp.]
MLKEGIRIEEIIRYFPINISSLLHKAIKQNEKLAEQIQEIRIRVGRPIILKLQNLDILIEYIVNQTEILQILEKICENSIYAYKNQICNGYITIKGGHRIGITGSAVVENEKIINIKYITSLNFRIARQVLNCSNKIIGQVIDEKNQDIYNTLIVSPPGRGKTTILRDLIRNLSNGIDEINFKGRTCGVVDERGEIAAMYKGVPQNDIGIRTDIIENISKAKGIKILIRTMAPEIIACDEIGSKEDVEAIQEAIISGVKGIFTMHGRTLDDVKSNNQINKLIEENKIEKIIFI